MNDRLTCLDVCLTRLFWAACQSTCGRSAFTSKQRFPKWMTRTWLWLAFRRFRLLPSNALLHQIINLALIKHLMDCARMDCFFKQVSNLHPALSLLHKTAPSKDSHRQMSLAVVSIFSRPLFSSRWMELIWALVSKKWTWASRSHRVTKYKGANFWAHLIIMEAWKLTVYQIRATQASKTAI